MMILTVEVHFCNLNLGWVVIAVDPATIATLAYTSDPLLSSTDIFLIQMPYPIHLIIAISFVLVDLPAFDVSDEAVPSYADLIKLEVCADGWQHDDQSYKRGSGKSHVDEVLNSFEQSAVRVFEELVKAVLELGGMDDGTGSGQNYELHL
jgi:hypothetical protein